MDKNSLEIGAFFARFLNNSVAVEGKIVSLVSHDELTLNDAKVIYGISYLTLENKNQIKYIADYLFITPAACSTAVKKLKKEGYVVGRKNNSDSRNTYLDLTDAAYEFIQNVNNFHSRIYHGYIHRFDENQVMDALEVLKKIDHILSVEDNYQTWKEDKYEKMSIQLKIDTCADLSTEDIKNTIILPIPVYIDDKEYIPFVNLQPEEFYALQKQAKTLPHTAQTPFKNLYEAFLGEIEKGNQVLCVLMGSAHSGTYNSACLARNQIAEELGDKVLDDIAIIDSQNVTFPLAALCFEARKMIDKGEMTLKEMEDKLNYLVPRIHMRAYIDDLTYLKLGGRISGMTAAIGNLLNFKIVIKTGCNLITPTNKLRGLPKTYNMIIETYLKEDVDTSYPVYIGHTNDLARAQKLESMLEEETHLKAEKIITIGATVGAHVGPGSTGLCWFVK